MKVIVTGSEGLIGKEVCKYLKKNKYIVIGFDNKLAPKYDIGKYDLTDVDNVEYLFKENKADALVNCFAYNPKEPNKLLLEQTVDDFMEYMDVNLTSLFMVCKEYAKNNKKGSIVNFSSTYGIVAPMYGLYGEADKDIGYSVSKAGVIMLTKQFATHLAPNIRVNCIVPGGVYNNQNEQFVKRYSGICPIGRMMDKKELPPLVEYLISNKSSYCTGGVFTIDGGWTG